MLSRMIFFRLDVAPQIVVDFWLLKQIKYKINDNYNINKWTLKWIGQGCGKSLDDLPWLLVLLVQCTYLTNFLHHPKFGW